MSPALPLTSAIALASVTPSANVTSRASTNSMVGSSSGRPSFTMRVIESMAADGEDVS